MDQMCQDNSLMLCHSMHSLPCIQCQANQALQHCSTVQFGELPKVNTNVPGLAVVCGLAESRKGQCTEHFFEPKLTSDKLHKLHKLYNIIIYIYISKSEVHPVLGDICSKSRSFKE